MQNVMLIRGYACRQRLNCILIYEGYSESTVCAYLSRILETVTLRMCSDFLHQLRSHRPHFVEIVLCICLFLCVNHV
jgi:hypothetical protein